MAVRFRTAQRAMLSLSLSSYNAAADCALYALASSCMRAVDDVAGREPRCASRTGLGITNERARAHTWEQRATRAAPAMPRAALLAVALLACCAAVRAAPPSGGGAAVAAAAPAPPEVPTTPLPPGRRRVCVFDFGAQRRAAKQRCAADDDALLPTAPQMTPSRRGQRVNALHPRADCMALPASRR